MKYSKIVLIHNSFSGQQSKRLSKEALLNLFSKEWQDRIIYRSTEKSDTYLTYVELIKKAQPELVIAAGGDGTLNPVAKACSELNMLMGIIPFGSGNGLARYLGFSMNAALAVKELMMSSEVEIDTATVNDAFFVCACGIGFDGLIAHKFASNKKRGFLSYIKEGIIPLFTYSNANYIITFDGKELKRKAFLVCVANINQYGNDAFIAPDANASDEQLNIVIVRSFSLLNGLFAFRRLFNKTIYQWNAIEHYKTNRVEINCDTKQCYHFDGEPACHERTFIIQTGGNKLRILRATK
ncbi:MAG TPA: YegS/Rv2252/BmrU family lipid kinase [Bacteroidia bacterium]|nr:YegS/Rv2252/BmrU family lipid kinase [Bacteroidia bacterium]HNT80920.1 YegS/Rv2252/BmrU family lipid kinase [Bacteroidia bacterium]